MKTQWPADKVERRPLSSLVPAARNARTHSPEQVAQLAASIREWGWTVPVLVDEGGRLIAGHGRVLAAAELGLASVPTMVAAGWSEAQVRAYRIADNKLALNAGWDDDLLRLELGELRGLEVDLGLLGFGTEELEALFAPPSAGLTDPDEAPEPPVRPASVLGDVWLLGRHRLVCGDSTDADTVAAEATRLLSEAAAAAEKAMLARVSIRPSRSASRARARQLVHWGSRVRSLATH